MGKGGGGGDGGWGGGGASRHGKRTQPLHMASEMLHVLDLCMISIENGPQFLFGVFDTHALLIPGAIILS